MEVLNRVLKALPVLSFSVVGGAIHLLPGQVVSSFLKRRIVDFPVFSTLCFLTEREYYLPGKFPH
ncbi:hypothetical protein JCM10003_1772 [Bacteroides pyogenes JCM 10003]|nr:putative membrane protein [Bacteroides pyogenes]GAE22202.1 hypothetical protein JCM10003_1772 [Bacteroides pyogenes JCM 10003]SUV32623.1 Uncharacterised protein [Bacteroides pyogenes]